MFTISSSTKAWNISGLKCAQVILPGESFAERWDASVLLQSVSSSTSTLGAVAAEAAYEHGSEWLERVKQYMSGNLNLVNNFVKESGVGGLYIPPEAFYLAWINLPQHALGENVAADAFFLDSSKVVVTGGQRFGSPNDRNAFRINFAASQMDLTEALNRMAQALSEPRSKARRSLGGGVTLAP